MAIALSGDPRFSEINLYRIAQESLNNVYKHAGASNVLVLLERRGAQIQLVIEDDVSTGHRGRRRRLRFPRCRATAGHGPHWDDGESRVGRRGHRGGNGSRHGTTVFVRVPLPAVASIRAVNQTADAADSDP
jgi:signal transduction histidine kinase